MAHWFRRTVLVASAVLMAASGGVTPAAAGGPTSVLLSASAIAKVAAVGYSDQAYVDLQEVVQAVDSTANSNPPTSAPESGRVIRAAWLIHDQTVWRLDTIYLDAAGGPWIATVESLEGRPSGEPVWHRSTNPAKLEKILGELGLLGARAASAAPTTAAAAPSAPPAAAPTQTVQAETSALTGWRWALPGFALGLLVAVAAVRLVPRRRQWELVDAD